MARSPSTQERLVASAAAVGGALMAIGAFLPWLSLFAGLHPLRGVIGLNGRLLAVGGAACLVAGVRCWRRPAPKLEWAVAALGWAFTGFGIWLTVQLLITYRELRTNPMLVPRLGPGLFLALFGALLAGATAALRLPAWRARHHGPLVRRHPALTTGSRRASPTRSAGTAFRRRRPPRTPARVPCRDPRASAAGRCPCRPAAARCRSRRAHAST